MAVNNKTGAPFNLELHTPGVPMNVLVTGNKNLQDINDGSMHKSVYDPDAVGGDAFEASNQKLTGYQKASAYSPVSETDDLMAALEKIEAGIGASTGDGDMTKAVYDKNNNGKVDIAEVAEVAQSVEWDNVSGKPNALPSPSALTVKLGGTDAAVYDGSEAKNVNITPDSIGAARTVDGIVDHQQLGLVDSIESTSTMNPAAANSVRAAVVAAKAYTDDQVAGASSALEATIATKATKDGTLQTNLNSEMLGGKTLADVQGYADTQAASRVSKTETMSQTLSGSLVAGGEQDLAVPQVRNIMFGYEEPAELAHGTIFFLLEAEGEG